MNDHSGGEHNRGECPPGKGKVNIPKIFDPLEGSKIKEMIMVALDPSSNMPLQRLESAGISKTYLQQLGYTFRS